MGILFDGSPNSTYMIVGEMPSEEDCRNGRAMSDPYGKSFWRIASRCGIDRADCYTVNTVGAFYDDEDASKHWNEWWDEFDSAVGNFRGRVIICLGGDAFLRATGLRGSHQEWAGYLVHPNERSRITRTRRVAEVYKTSNAKRGIKKGDPKWVNRKEEAEPVVSETVQWVLTAQTPGAIFRSGFSTAPLMVSCLQKAHRAATGSLRPSRSEFSRTPQPITERIFSLDLEGYEAIERVGIATATSAWTAPWDAQSAAYVRAACENPDNLVIIHNANFDVKMLEQAGIKVLCKIHDTMIGAAVNQPDLRKGLAFCGGMYLDCERWKPPRAKDRYTPPKETGSQRIDCQDDETYNALDTIREYELYLVEVEELALHGQTELFSVMMDTLPTLIRMQQRGIKIHPARKQEWVEKLQRECGKLVQTWTQVAGAYDFSSPPQVKNWLRSIGAKLPPGKKGSDSSDREALYLIKARQPELADKIDLLVAVRKAHKDLTTYASIVAALDGRVHASFALESKDEDGQGKELAGTLRITAKNPNMQNQTKESRRMYIPEVDHCFIVADYGSLEARLLAALCGDTVLAADLAGDLHRVNSELLGIDRVSAKMSFYGWAYGQGEKSLYNAYKKAGYNIPTKVCKELLESFETKYKIATNWRFELAKKAEALRYVVNPFKYRRYFPELEFPRTKVLNTFIQSTGALMMWYRLGLLDQRMTNLGAELLLMVHDNVVVECPTEMNLEVARCIKETMEAPFHEIAPGFSCPVDIKWSTKSWGELEKLDV